MASSTIDEARKMLERRLSELDNEREKVVGALKGLGTARRGPGRPRKSSVGRRPARRRRKGGTRAEHALRALKEKPGMTASEIAKKLGINPNYMYRVLNDLKKQGLVRKQGKGYAAKG